MKNYDFDWQINEFMIYCRSTQLRERTMYSYEQTLRLFERWLCDELKIYSVDKVTENMIRKYIRNCPIDALRRLLHTSPPISRMVFSAGGPAALF